MKPLTAKALRTADRFMTSSKTKVRVPRVLAEYTLSPEQLRDIRSKVKLKLMPQKGLGLVARAALPADTRVGIYGGKVFSAKDHGQLVKRGDTTGKYSVDFFTSPGQGGDKGRDDLIMEPGVGNGMQRRHANVLAAFINEPGVGQKPNVVWVRNYETNTMELWTTRPVAKGEELTACYGNSYARDYTTPCTAKPGAMHYIKKGWRKPRLL